MKNGRRKRGTLVGEVFAYLMVERFAFYKDGNRLWLTRCQQWINGKPCGNLRIVSTAALNACQIYACESCTDRMKREALAIAGRRQAEKRRAA